MGILDSDDEEKSKGDDSNGSKHVSSGGESDHKVSGEEGELVNDGRGDVWHGSSKLKKSSHEIGHGSFSIWLGVMKGGFTHTSGCSVNSGRASVSGPAISERID